MLDFSFFWYLAFTTGHTLLQFKDCDNLVDEIVIGNLSFTPCHIP
jgi:hypothetical protein